jgi:hypothetical protein
MEKWQGVPFRNHKACCPALQYSYYTYLLLLLLLLYYIYEELIRLLLVSSDVIDKDTVVSSGDISTKTMLSVSYDFYFLVCSRCFLFALHYATLIIWVGLYNFLPWFRELKLH